MNDKEWLELTRQTYQTRLKELMKEYPGKIVAIDGNEVVDVGDNLSNLFAKYRARGQRVELYYVPMNENDVLSEDLVLPVNLLP